MSHIARNYGSNLYRLLRGQRLLRPLAATYYLTSHCNLNCRYCEDFGARRNDQAEDPLALDDARRVLDVLRSGVDSLILTGGEPLLYPGLDDLMRYARQELAFRHITVLTNALLLPEHEAILPHLDRLVISLDSVDPAHWHTIIGAPLQAAQRILDNVCTYATQQQKWGYRMVLNCVLTPETLPGAKDVLNFCAEHDILASFSPQAIHNWPNYDLLVSDAYKAFLARLVRLKKRGAPILGSLAYLRTLLKFLPYSCYPTLVPRVMPNGDMVYPCRPIEREQDSHGGRPCNLLQVDSWEQATQIALEAYGQPPRTCSSCFQQCFAEPSLMQARPLALLHELIRYPASRQGGILRYAPG